LSYALQFQNFTTPGWVPAGWKVANLRVVFAQPTQGVPVEIPASELGREASSVLWEIPDEQCRILAARHQTLAIRGDGE